MTIDFFPIEVGGTEYRVHKVKSPLQNFDIYKEDQHFLSLLWHKDHWVAEKKFIEDVPTELAEAITDQITDYIRYNELFFDGDSLNNEETELDEFLARATQLSEEKFDVEINGQCYTLVPVDAPEEDNINHEVWKDGKLLFVIYPGLNSSANPWWRVTDAFKDESIDSRLIDAIGDALEARYL